MVPEVERRRDAGGYCALVCGSARRRKGRGSYPKSDQRLFSGVAMIDGVIVTSLRQIFDERGKVMHMLREDSAVFTRFGEVYFSCVYPGAVKAWHLHKRMVLNYAVIFGEVKFVLYDDRPGSSTCGQVQEFFLSPENYCLITVPPLLWN